MLDAIHSHLGSGLPGGTRTPDLQLRRLLLYPVELLAVTISNYTTQESKPAARHYKSRRVTLY